MKIQFDASVSAARQERISKKMGSVFAFGAPEIRGLTDEAREMRLNRRVTAKQTRALQKTGFTGGGGGAGGDNIQFATGRPRDPLFYWRQNNLPYDFSQNEELAKVRSFCRLLYQTDPLIGSCVDIFSKFPVLGQELSCKDSKIEDFHGNLFFDEDHLDYEEFLVDIGREYYTAGEAWPFATFNEDLGIWDDEELLNPDDIKVERSPFLKEPRYFIKLPWTIRQILQTRQPAWEYNKLIKEYPELAAYTSENAFMPVSNILLRQLKFKGDTFNVRGVPLLTRAMRSLLQQEMLNTAMDAIADRLYTPLILCKLGASATDLGTSVPWIPTDDDLENFELALDAALAGDFRALIHNFAVEIEPVFGREQMPDLGPDFERIEDRVLQVFGLSRTFLQGAQGGQTYAADALNKELVTMLMTRYQRYLVRHVRQRALVVAEAQEHYDYNEHNGKRYVKMEEILVTDEETGEKRIQEQPKLLVPDLKFRTLNLKDEDTIREFMEALRASGVPISMKTRTRNLGIDLDEEIEESREEAIDQIVAEQETRKGAFLALRAAGLPIPGDLLNDFAPIAQIEGMAPAAAAEAMAAIPRLGSDDIVGTPNLVPTPEDMAEEEQAEPGGEPADDQESEPGAEPGPGEYDQVPEESSDEREGMPAAQARRKRGAMPSQAALFRRTARIRDIARDAEAQRRVIAEAERAAGKEPEPLQERRDHEDAAPWFSGPDLSMSAFRDPVHVGTRALAPVTSGTIVRDDLYAPWDDA